MLNEINPLSSMGIQQKAAEKTARFGVHFTQIFRFSVPWRDEAAWQGAASKDTKQRPEIYHVLFNAQRPV